MIESVKESFFSDRETTLRREREARNLTISELSRLAWVNAAELSKMERGRVIPYEKQARRIATAIGWEGDLAELFSSADGDGNDRNSTV